MTLADEVLESFRKEETKSVEETESGYVVKLPYPTGGYAVFSFEAVEERGRNLYADVSVKLESPGQTKQTFGAHLDLKSLSNRDTYRRALDSTYGKGFWDSGLAEACEMVRKADAERDWSVNLAGVVVSDKQEYAHYPLLPADGPTIWFGQGESGKTYLLLALLVSKVLGRDFFGSPLVTSPVIFLDYEATQSQVKRRIRNILVGFGLSGIEADIDEFFQTAFIYWPGRGRRLATILPALKRKIKETKAGLLAIDSGALACGKNPKDEDAALDYFNALSSLTIPTVTLCHMTKAADDEYHPYGTIYWHTCARMTWNIKAAERNDGEPLRVGLICRKANEDERPVGFEAHLTFREQGGVVVTKEKLSADFDTERTVQARIRYALGSRSLSAKELSSDLRQTGEAIRSNLSRMRDVICLGKSDDGSNLWALKTDRQE